MRLPLRHHVHAAAVGEDLVLLDVAADRYLCLPAALEADGSGGWRLREGELGPLAAAGLLGADGAALDPPPRPTRGLPASAAPATFMDGVRLALCLADLLTAYAGRPFRSVLAAAAAGAAGRASEAEALRLAAVFERLVVWAPVPRKCLVRSFLLMRFLARAGARGRWVIGVRTWPFAAHCWVQAGDVVLDDAPERLSRYTPILAV